MLAASIPCPLCKEVPLEWRSVGQYFCAKMHGAFHLRGRPDAATGFVAGWLEHATTGLSFDLGMFTAGEWVRLAEEADGDGKGTGDAGR